MGGGGRLRSTVSTRRKGLDRGTLLLQCLVGRRTRDEGRGTRDERGRFGRVDDSIHHPCFSDVPFEFVGKVARAGAMAEASDIECCSTSRHAADLLKLSLQRNRSCCSRKGSSQE